MTNSSEPEILCMSLDGAEWPVTVERYPGGEPLVRERNVPVAMLLRPKRLTTFFAALWWVDALAERGIPAPRLVLPYAPGARQDRMNASGDVLFTAKSVAREINLRSFPKVTVFDPHSDVIAGLIDRCTVVHADIFPARSASYDGVIAPDAGAEKRASLVAQRLGVELYRGWKERDVTTGALKGFGVQMLGALCHYLVVDDICDGGGTFLGLAERIDSLGATADLYTSHGLYTQGTDALLRAFPRVFCTDSTLGAKPGVTVFPIALSLLRGRS